MAKDTKRIILIALAVAGAVVWIAIGAMTGRSEAWDSDVFWQLGTPLMMLINAVACFLDSRKILVKGFVSVSLQPVIMMIQNWGDFDLLPLGLILFIFLGMFYSIGGAAGAFVKNKFFP